MKQPKNEATDRLICSPPFPSRRRTSRFVGGRDFQRDVQILATCHGLMRVTFVSGSAVAFANAGVSWVLAFAANLGVIVNAKILRLGVGARPDLDDDTVALPLGKGVSGNKCVPGFLEIERSRDAIVPTPYA